MRKIGGYSDWRLPSIDEAASLHDEAFENKGKGGATIHIDPVFSRRRVQEVSGSWATPPPAARVLIMSKGKVTGADEYAFGATRLCRKESAVRDHTRPPVRH